MITAYFASMDRQKLEQFTSSFANVMGFREGGAVGHPEKTYASIRLPFDESFTPQVAAFFAPLMPEGVEIVDTAEGAAVCGVWA